ncbi:unnamed protein product [Gadus morhua 'NCC']
MCHGSPFMLEPRVHSQPGPELQSEGAGAPPSRTPLHRPLCGSHSLCVAPTKPLDSGGGHSDVSVFLRGVQPPWALLSKRSAINQKAPLVHRV